jgi:co-chaperonin GroES (HSP10)
LYPIKYIDIMNFQPNGSWVVLPDPTVTQTESGIILDDTTIAERSKNSNILEVLATGPACTFVQPGDTVMVDPRTEAVKSEIEGKPYLIVGEFQILGKL